MISKKNKNTVAPCQSGKGYKAISTSPSFSGEEDYFLVEDIQDRTAKNPRVTFWTPRPQISMLIVQGLVCRSCQEKVSSL